MPKKSSDAPGPGAARLHGELLTTSLLAFLKSANAYGYELAQRLADAGLPPFDTGALYRTLRQLEAAGFVSSAWDTSESGPARRMYSLTRAGELFLEHWVGVMQAYQAVLDAATSGLQASRPPQPEPPADEQHPE